MTEEEKEAIKYFTERMDICLENANICDDNNFDEEAAYLRKEQILTETLLNLIQKQQEEIEKLRNKNKDLLRKLRNRVKEVKKLSKYSLYKEEFSRLNKRIEKKDKVIDLMAPRIYLTEQEREEMKKYICTSNKPRDFSSFVKQYFESKV